MSNKNASHFPNKFHQIKVFNVRITKNASCVGTLRFSVEFALSSKISEFGQKSTVDLNGPTRKTVRYATGPYEHGRGINSDSLLWLYKDHFFNAVIIIIFSRYHYRNFFKKKDWKNCFQKF